MKMNAAFDIAMSSDVNTPIGAAFAIYRFHPILFHAVNGFRRKQTPSVDAASSPFNATWPQVRRTGKGQPFPPSNSVKSHLLNSVKQIEIVYHRNWYDMIVKTKRAFVHDLEHGAKRTMVRMMAITAKTEKSPLPVHSSCEICIVFDQ